MNCANIFNATFEFSMNSNQINKWLMQLSFLILSSTNGGYGYAPNASIYYIYPTAFRIALLCFVLSAHFIVTFSLNAIYK